MLHWERATVTGSRSSWRGVDRLQVEIERDGRGADASVEAETVSAIAYPELTGTPALGESVLLNTNALRRGLGTGGDALVVARLDVLPAPEEIAGHMVKARYTPMQTMVDAIDDPEGEHYATMQGAEDLGGMPVLVADLHSSLPALVAGIRAERHSAKIVYVHTDGASLPAA